MTTFATKTKNAETDSAKSKGAVRKSNDLRADSINNSAPLFGFPIQRKASCACGGDCPNCQAKNTNLSITEPDDHYEKEADTVADKVMRMSANSTENEEIQLKPTVFSQIQRKCSFCEDDEKIQRKESGNSGGDMTAPPMVSDVILSSGKLLNKETQQFMEDRIGYDFSHVQIHTDSKAVESAQSINALAYTLGNHIVFNSGQYAPETEKGKRLLAHELAHVAQQKSSSNILSKIQRRELKDELGLRLFNSRGPGDWYFSDRMQWQQASVGGSINALPQANTFIRAAIYNTQNLRDGEYQNIEQRHDYYDLISYAIQYDPNTPAAARGVRFFDATTIVTGSPGIGTASSPLGAIMLRQETRIILREVNAELFRFNMGIIKELLFNWREPRSPQSPAGQIGAFEFDIQMVEAEQSRVENYIRRERTRFTPQVTQDINDTMDPNATGQRFNPSQRSFQWAIQALGVSNLDFTIREHRMAIGFATVHIVHKKTLQEYLAFMQTRISVPIPQNISRSIYTIANFNGVNLNEGIPGPLRHFENISQGTQVRILDETHIMGPFLPNDDFAGKANIEVLEGPNTGAIGWAEYSDIQH